MEHNTSLYAWASHPKTTRRTHHNLHYDSQLLSWILHAFFQICVSSLSCNTFGTQLQLPPLPPVQAQWSDRHLWGLQLLSTQGKDRIPFLHKTVHGIVKCWAVNIGSIDALHTSRTCFVHLPFWQGQHRNQGLRDGNEPIPNCYIAYVVCVQLIVSATYTQRVVEARHYKRLPLLVVGDGRRIVQIPTPIFTSRCTDTVAHPSRCGNQPMHHWETPSIYHPIQICAMLVTSDSLSSMYLDNIILREGKYVYKCTKWVRLI